MTVFEAAELNASETKTETTLVPALNQVLPTSSFVVEATGQRYMQTMQLISVCERSHLFKRGRYANYQTTDPTRVGMPRWFKARAVRHSGCPVHFKVRLPNTQAIVVLL